jgi:hypothetical protein
VESGGRLQRILYIMQKQKPIIETSLTERADERERSDQLRTMTKVASGLVSMGLVVSAGLTVFYLTLLVNDAAGLPDPYGVLLGLLVGVVAIVPAELALVVWKERLAGQENITGGQRTTAVTALFLAGIFAALTTSSFFSYFLPQLFTPGYIAAAPMLNVAGIVGAWVVFIMAIVMYSITSRETNQNLSQAKAFQAMFDARMSVLKAAAEAIRTDAENTINAMEQGGVFERDARQLIIASLGMDDNRLDLLPEPAVSSVPSQTSPNSDRRGKTAVSPTPSPAYAKQDSSQERPSIGFGGGSRDVNLVDMAEAMTSAAVSPTPKMLTFENGQWMTTWVASDGQGYAAPISLDPDPAIAWADVGKRGIVPHGMTYRTFADLHGRQYGRQNQTPDNGANFTNRPGNGRQGG